MPAGVKVLVRNILSNRAFQMSKDLSKYLKKGFLVKERKRFMTENNQRKITGEICSHIYGSCV